MIWQFNIQHYYSTTPTSGFTFLSTYYSGTNIENLSCDLCVFVASPSLVTNREIPGRKGSRFCNPYITLNSLSILLFKGSVCGQLVLYPCSSVLWLLSDGFWSCYLVAFREWILLLRYAYPYVLYQVLHRVIIIFKLIIQCTNCLVISRGLKKGIVSHFQTLQSVFYKDSWKKRLWKAIVKQYTFVNYPCTSV